MEEQDQQPVSYLLQCRIWKSSLISLCNSSSVLFHPASAITVVEGSWLKFPCFLFLILPCSHWFSLVQTHKMLLTMGTCYNFISWCHFRKIYKLNFTFFYNFFHLNIAKDIFLQLCSLILNFKQHKIEKTAFVFTGS